MSTARLFVDTVQVGPSLQLQRLPTFLRFTKINNSWSFLDALDMTTDEPKPEETLMAAKLIKTTRVHLDRIVNRRRIGDWHTEARYELVDPQPADEIMRDTAKWQAWCLEQQAESETPK